MGGVADKNAPLVGVALGVVTQPVVPVVVQLEPAQPTNTYHARRARAAVMKAFLFSSSAAAAFTEAMSLLSKVCSMFSLI